MRPVFLALLLFAFALSLALVMVEGLNKDIHRQSPPSRFDPDAPLGKRFQPPLSQLY